MKPNRILTTLALSGVTATVLLTGCGGGGGGGGPVTTAATPTEVPWTITSVDAVTASVRVTNTSTSTGSIKGTYVVLSTLKTENTGSDPIDSSASVKVKDVVLYNSREDTASSYDIAASGNQLFQLKNVNFAAASSDTGTSATSASCTSASDAALGEVRLEVFGENGQLFEGDVPVCAIQGLTYSVNVSN